MCNVYGLLLFRHIHVLYSVAFPQGSCINNVHMFFRNFERHPSSLPGVSLCSSPPTLNVLFSQTLPRHEKMFSFLEAEYSQVSTGSDFLLSAPKDRKVGLKKQGLQRLIQHSGMFCFYPLPTLSPIASQVPRFEHYPLYVNVINARPLIHMHTSHRYQ